MKESEALNLWQLEEERYYFFVIRGRTVMVRARSAWAICMGVDEWLSGC